MKKLIGVYGTLKRGFSNHYVLGNSKKVGDFKTEPKFTMFSYGSFPGITNTGNTSIVMEVYEVVDEDILNRLYWLEGYNPNRKPEDNFYNIMEINSPYGKIELFYIIRENVEFDSLNIIKDGEWK